MIEHAIQPAGLSAPNGFSHAASGVGRLVAVSGQLPLDANGRLVGDDPAEQARQVFANIDLALAAVGAGAADLLRIGFFLVNLADLPAIRAARDAFLGDAPAPASTLVQVAGLVVPGARFEVDALAVVG